MSLCVESSRGEGLSKTAIGDYLGEKSPFHEQVLKAFVDLHDFTDLILVQALRYLLLFPTVVVVVVVVVVAVFAGHL